MPIKCETVLIVEDDTSIRETLKTALEFEGYRVETAENGQVAIELLKTNLKPCLILLDLMMPVMNGWEFLQYRKTDDVLMTIPTAIVSAAVDTSIKTATGAQAIIKKPIDLTTLLNWVKLYCAAA